LLSLLIKQDACFLYLHVKPNNLSIPVMREMEG